jgi:hypothetical protein
MADYERVWPISAVFVGASLNGYCDHVIYLKQTIECIVAVHTNPPLFGLFWQRLLWSWFLLFAMFCNMQESL